MKLAMVDLKKQYASIKNEIDAAINETVESTAFILGKKVADFEKEAASYLGVKHAIGCANGTEALQIAMMALDIKPGDEIITTPFTFVATTETIALLGAIPVYVDIDDKTFNIDPEQIEKAITKKTKAIIPVHLYGHAADMDKIMAVAKKHNLYVIEDMAQAFGTEYKGKKVGGIGTVAATSFFPSKNLGCYGDGGMLFTNDTVLADKIRMIVNHGSKERYVHETLGLNSRLDTIQAAVLSVKLKYLDKWNKMRAENAKKYDAKLKTAKVITPAVAEYSTHIFHQYTIRVENRDKLKDVLSAKGIPFGVYYPIPLHQQPAYKHIAKGSGLDVTEKLTHEVISLPMYPELTDEEIDYITQPIIEFTGKK
ncbi:MAG TPA: DegT/DnrJ/EryC1/StrS family aminotransferase [Ignavibacteriales bacterium]|nr:DegT/DnrJ/EryC1/StrS family aminotransferase [Ignavibacteriales bacterium]